MNTTDRTRQESQQVCQHDCHSRCCRYITVVLPAPRLSYDFDELSWFLAHENISVYVESRRWHLEVRTPCKYLDRDNLCTIYADRPDVCREYDIEACEFPRRPRHTLHFDTRQEFHSWLTKRQEKRRRKRRAARRRKARASVRDTRPAQSVRRRDT